MGKKEQNSDTIVPNGGLSQVINPQKIKDNQWTEGLNVEAMADGVRRRRGSEVENTIPLQGVTVEFENGSDTREFIDGTSEYIAQSFQSTSVMNVLRVGVKFKINAGAPTGNITCAIAEDDGLGPPTAPDITSPYDNGDFSDFTSIDSATELNGEGTWYHFTTSQAVVIPASTTAWVVLFHAAAAATGTSTVDVVERTSSVGTSPELLNSGLQMKFQLDPDDITGIADTNNTVGTVLPDKSGNFEGWAEFAGGTLGCTMHTAAGAAPVNGHAWIEQPATACKLALSGQSGNPFPTFFPGEFTLGAVYKPSSTTTNLGYMMGRKDGSTENGLSVPKKHISDGKYGLNNDSGTPVHGDSPQDTDTTDPLIMIIRRTSAGVMNGYGTINGGTAVDFGDISSGQTGLITMDSLFRVDTDTVADAGFGIVYLVGWEASLSAGDVDELYHWLATRFNIAFAAGSTVGNVAFSTDGSSWTDAPAADMIHRVYGASAPISGIQDFQKTDGTQRHIVSADGEHYKNVAGAMTLLSTRRQGARDPSNGNTYGGANKFDSYAIGGNRLFVTTDGDKTAQKFYIDAAGTEIWASEGITKPSAVTIAPSAVDAFSTDGNYYVDYYLWDKNIGQPSDRAYGGVASSSNLVATTSDGIDVSGLPTSFSASDFWTHIRLELREPNSAFFRLVKEIPIGQASVNLGESDLPTTIEGEYNHARSAPHKIKLVAENRHFIANFPAGADPVANPALPFRMGYSAINGITPYYESFPATNYRDFGIGDDDFITALMFMPPQTIVIGMKNRLYAIDARRPGTSDRYTISQTEGIAHHLSATVIKDTLYFLSDSAQSRGFYRWRQGLAEPERLRGADRDLATMETTRFRYASSISAATDADRNQWWTLLTSSGNTEPDTIFVYDVALDAWAVFTKGAGRTLNVLGVVEESDVDLVFGGGYNGIEYKQDIGEDDAGQAFTGSFKGKWLDFGSLRKKSMRGVHETVLGVEGELAATLEVDYGKEQTRTNTINMSPAGRDNIVSSNELHARGQVFRFGFSGSTPWYLKTLTMQVQFEDDE